MYLDALKDFPSQENKLYTEKGMAFCQKTDIFKGLLWYSYKDDPSRWHTLTKDQVKEIIQKNKTKEKVASLEIFATDNLEAETTLFDHSAGQDSLTRFDRPKNNKRRKKNNKRRKNSPKSSRKNA
jgi:hypothetical protein